MNSARQAQAENIDYHKDRGLDRVVERAYPITVPVACRNALFGLMILYNH